MWLTIDISTTHFTKISKIINLFLCYMILLSFIFFSPLIHNNYIGLNKVVDRKNENHKVKITLRNFFEIWEGILTSLTYNKIWKIKESLRKTCKCLERKQNSVTTNLDIEILIVMHFTFLSIVKAFLLKCWQFVKIYLPYFKSTKTEKYAFSLKKMFSAYCLS